MMEYAHKLHPLPIRNWRFHTIAKPSYNMKETKRESIFFLKDIASIFTYVSLSLG
jgi:hypothetical protein